MSEPVGGDRASEVEVRLGARGVSRRFGPILANDAIDLAVAPGSIHGVVGENGAGKTTLMRILYGFDHPDQGTVIVDDEPTRLMSPNDAIARGIGMVHQEFMLVPELTLLENLVLGDEPVRRGVIDWARARSRADVLAADAGVDLPWDVPATRTSVAAQQRLEILRLLYRGADTLILDEPTAVLAPSQTADLFELLRRLRADGATVVFISHKLDEVLALTDTVTVLRSGRAIATRPTEQLDGHTIAQLMVGEAPASAPPRSGGPPGDEVLVTRDLRASDDRGIQRLAGADLVVRRGEIVGIAGVADNGQDELVECLVGIRRPENGTVTLSGADVTDASVAERRAAGLAYISADRAHEGLAIDASLSDNVIAGRERRREFATRGVLRTSAIARFVQRVVERYGIRHGDPSHPVASLSGGNQQRLVVGREFEADPDLLVAAQPTRGVDIKGIGFVHEQLLALRDRGAAVLVVSEELEELESICDRIVVLLRGAVVGEVPGAERRREELGRLMTTGEVTT